MKNINQQERSESLDRKIYIFCRYFVAFMVVSYGWAKLMGSQFTILDSELDKPMGEVSGFWLTWYYFGYSPIYGNFIGLLQIVCGFLLIWRKTVLISACILLGVIGNIILVDIFYGVDAGALMMALMMEGALLVVLNFHRQELIKTFWKIQNSVFPSAQKTFAFRYIKIFAVFVIAVLPPSCTYYIANYNNRLPTELDGKWQVIKTSAPLAQDNRELKKIYFEHNRAFMTVFRYGDDKWITHHFEINPQTKQIGIWKNWLSKDEKIFDGRYEILDNQLILDGELTPENQLLRIELEKR